MNRNIIYKFAFGIAVIALVFGVMSAFPSVTNAYGYDGYSSYGYNYGNYGNYSNPYGSSFINQYGYNRPTVIVQQPQYIPVQTPVYVQQPVYYSTPTYYPTYSPLSVSCSANTTSVYANYSVTWTASVSGGNGQYSYYWSGTDGLSGYGQSIAFTYSYVGTKTATITVTSNGQSVTQACSNSVYVNNQSYSYVYPTYVNNTYNRTYPTYTVASNNLDIGCYADPSSSRPNQPVTWSAEVTGGAAPYTYSWTGSDGLSGNQSSVTKYYDQSGSKSAVVSVTSADGKTGTRACTNTLAVSSGQTHYAVKAAPAAQASQPASTNSSQAAASFLSLSNVPWGWIALLVILVLFFTVIYLLFNRLKI